MLWLSTTVVKICVFLVGIVELRSISLVNSPPWVSTPSDSGVMSSSTRSLMSPRRMPPWMAAPMATTSSGLISRFGLLPKIRSTAWAHQGGAGLAADQQHLVDLVGAQAGAGEGVEAGALGALDEVAHQLLELAAGERAGEVARARAVGRDERQVDRRLLGRRQLALGALGRLLQALEGHAVLAQVDAGLAAEPLDQPVHDPLVEVLAAEVGVAGGRAHLEDPLRELEDRDVEGAAAEVVDGDRAGGRAAAFGWSRP